MFPEPHNLLTIHWTTIGATGEGGQVGLRFDGPGPVSQTMVDDAAAAVTAFWGGAGSQVPSTYLLGFLRLARIGTNGEYVPGTQSWDHVYAPAVAGGNTPAAQLPLQVAACETLLTGLTHGLAHSGRIYLPPVASALDGTYNWTTAAANGRINALAAMLSTLSGSSLGALAVYSFGNTDFPSGAKRLVTGVRMDLRPDVQRRRARQQVTAYSLVGNVT